jgi:CheY-like chemotaxis protein
MRGIRVKEPSLGSDTNYIHGRYGPLQQTLPGVLRNPAHGGCMSPAELERLNAASSDSGRPEDPKRDGPRSEGPPSGKRGPAVRPRVLLIDDDAELRLSLEIGLKRHYEVISVSHADAGITAAGPNISVVLLDIKMDGKDGFAAYAEICAKDPDLPIIFYSAYQGIKDPYEIINKFRPYGYVTKGQPLSTLIELIDHAVAHRQRLAKHRDLAAELALVRAEMEALRKRLDGG